MSETTTASARSAAEQTASAMHALDHASEPAQLDLWLAATSRPMTVVTGHVHNTTCGHRRSQGQPALCYTCNTLFIVKVTGGVKYCDEHTSQPARREYDGGYPTRMPFTCVVCNRHSYWHGRTGERFNICTRCAPAPARKQMARYNMTPDFAKHYLTVDVCDMPGCEHRFSTHGTSANAGGRNVDHNHNCDCGKTRGSCGNCNRGVLCANCNTALGKIERVGVRNVATYLGGQTY